MATVARTGTGPKAGGSGSQLDAIIVGAGFAGLYQLHCLRDRLGLSAVVLEAGDGIGGTWYWNRYPGARCDSESHNYCFTFSEELFKSWTWSERYPGHAEIRRYFDYVADRLDLKRDIRLSTRVTAASYDEAARLWHVTTDTGERLSAPFLITAVGCLSTANVPKIPGLESFKGRWYHTGLWPHDDVDFTGKRVGQIGTGSTGIQAAPVIAETAQHLTVFQRTANYSVPAHNAPLTEEFKRWVAANYATIRADTHATANGHSFKIDPRSALEVSAEERQRAYEAAWKKGGLQFRATFRDIPLDEAANKTASDFIKAKIRSIVKDKATADLLADIDHPYAAKRPPIDSFYFETFNRPNVELVDVRRDPIVEITPTGLRTGKRAFELDVIVFATGFDAMTGPLLRVDIRGRGGKPLAETWKAGPVNYLGLGVAGFPNLFMITGPGSPSVLTNMPVAIEQHVEWISACIERMRRQGHTTIEARPEAMERWGAEVERAAHTTLLPKAAHSWYLGANIPGKPRMFMPYAGGMAHYRRLCADVAGKGYEGFQLS